MEGAAFDVVCVGAVNVDTIVPVDHVPADDERTTSAGFVVGGGGPAATAAVTIARLGGRVAFCGAVGDDPEGRLARELLDAEGVDTRWLRVHDGAATARAVVMTARSTGGRSIVTTIAPAPDPAEVPTGVAGWLHADQIGYAPARAALAADRGGARFSVDAGNPIDGLSLEGVDLYAPTVSVLLSRYELGDGESVGDGDGDGDGDGADEVGGELERAMLAARAEGAGLVVATAGASGSYLLEGERAVHVPSTPVRPVSTLGAGDVFHGALLARLAAGEPPSTAVRQANLVASISCRAIDGRSGIPTLRELRAAEAAV